jgi:hypothetical protein
MTRHLYDDLEPFAKSAAEKVYDGNLGSALGCLRQKIRFVQGDPVTGAKSRISIPSHRSCGLPANEVGDWTAMYPED